MNDKEHFEEYPILKQIKEQSKAEKNEILKEVFKDIKHDKFMDF